MLMRLPGGAWILGKMSALKILTGHLSTYRWYLKLSDWMKSSKVSM